MNWAHRLPTAPLFNAMVRVIGGFFIAAVLVGCSTPALDGESVVATATPETAADDSQSAAPGVTDDQILFGQSAAFSGPAVELGTNMEFGIRAAFHEVNQKGGVHGRELVLLIADDRYEPEAAIANTRNLIEEHGVFALIGAVGTPTSRSAVPVAFEAGVPYIAPFTGAEFLRNPDLFNVVNMRASYYQETEEMVDRLTTDLGVTRIGVLYQGRLIWPRRLQRRTARP